MGQQRAERGIKPRADKPLNVKNIRLGMVVDVRVPGIWEYRGRVTCIKEARLVPMSVTVDGFVTTDGYPYVCEPQYLFAVRDKQGENLQGLNG